MAQCEVDVLIITAVSFAYLLLWIHCLPSTTFLTSSSRDLDAVFIHRDNRTPKSFKFEFFYTIKQSFSTFKVTAINGCHLHFIFVLIVVLDMTASMFHVLDSRH